MAYFYDKDMVTDIVEEGKVSRKIKAYDGKLMIVEVSFQKGAIGYNHVHPHEQVCYVLEGEFTFTIENESKVVKAGDSMYINPNADHGCVLLSDSGRLLDIFTPIREDFLK